MSGSGHIHAGRLGEAEVLGKRLVLLVCSNMQAKATLGAAAGAACSTVSQEHHVATGISVRVFSRGP